MPDAGRAPQFSGPTPPDRQQMSFSELLNGALQKLQSDLGSGGALAPEDARALKAFVMGTDALFRQAMGQQQGAGGPAGPSQEQPSSDTQDYGADAGTPKPQGSAL